MNWFHDLWQSRWYDRIYKIGVGIKGFNGTVELIAGIWLWAFPESLRGLLTNWHDSAVAWDTAFGDVLAATFLKAHAEMYGGVLAMAIVFFLSHGIIKLILVYALLKEILWTYPYALAVLGVFVIAQVVAVIARPGFGMSALLVLNVLILIIVWGEWIKLKADFVARTVSEKSE